MLAVIKQNAAEKITRTINAPIFKDRICQINLTVSKFSTFGGMWQSFSDDRKLFRLDPAGGDKTVILNVSVSTLFKLNCMEPFATLLIIPHGDLV
jgi:hypothetical protein